MEVERLTYYNSNGIALDGYDVVAYFTLNKAAKGSSKFACMWNNLLWMFCNEEHLELFSENPEKYAPQFGGFCAFGVSNGYKASTRPEAFSIVDGKLYLNFAKYVRRRWSEKQASRILSADETWDSIKSEVPIRAHPIPIWWKYQLLKLVGRDLFG